MESNASNSNLPEQRNTEDHMGFNQNEESIASFNKLRDEVLCLKTQVSELRVDELRSLAKKMLLTQCKSVPVHPLNATYYCTNARRGI